MTLKTKCRVVVGTGEEFDKNKRKGNDDSTVLKSRQVAATFVLRHRSQTRANETRGVHHKY